jgi:prepilin-type processing-associated H-X9-DG protein
VLLAAILFPVFARARENARRASCQSNQKQLSLGLIQYTQDYDEHLPFGRSSATHFWGELIYPYVKSTQVFICPSDTKQEAIPPSGVPVPDFYSYGINMVYTDAAHAIFGPFAGDTPMSLAAVDDASGTIWLGDASDTSMSTLQGYAVFYVGANPVSLNDAGCKGVPCMDTSWGAGIMGRHLDTANVAFLDGHVKAMPITKLVQKDSTNTYYSYFTPQAD